MPINSIFRSLTHAERELLERLFKTDFPGRAELRKQVDLALVRTIDRDGSLSFSVSTPDESPANTGKETADELLAQGLPVEGRYFDVDGIPVCVMLHVSRGRLHELEILKADGSHIVRKPQDAELVLGRPTSGEVLPPGHLWPSG